MRRFTAVAACVATMLVIAACGGGDSGESEGGEPSSGSTYKVGYAAGQTGFLAIFEEAFLKGLQTEVEAINAAGGIDGKTKVELVVRDGASDPQRTATVVQNLIDDGIQFLISPCDIDVSVPGALLAAQEEIPTISSCGGAASFREQVGDFAFQNLYGTIAQGQGMAEFAWDQGYRTAAIMTSKDLEYTESMMRSAAERFEELGGEVVHTETFKLNQPRYTTQSSGLAGAQPDVVMTSMFLPASVTFLKNLRTAGYQGPLIGSDGMEGTETFSAGAAAEDVYVTSFGFPGEAPGNDQAAATRRFFERYEQQHGEPPGLIIAALGGDAAILIDAAVTAAGTTEGEQVRAALQELEDVQGATGRITYAGQGGTPAKDVVILKTNVPEQRFEFVTRFVPEAVTAGADG